MKRKQYLLVYIGVAIVMSMAGGTLSANSQTASPQKYTFKLKQDSKISLIQPQLYSLEGKDEPQPGDVIGIEGNMIVLGEPGTYVFEDKTEADGCLYQINKDGSRTVIAVTICNYRACSCDSLHKHFPLDKMNAEEIRKLRGVAILEGGEAHLKKLKYINPSQTALYIWADNLYSPNKKKCEGICKHIPAKVEYLAGEALYAEELNKQCKLGNLRFLSSEVGWDLDLNFFNAFGQLKYLKITNYSDSYCGNENINFKESLNLRNLRFLRISGCRKLTDISFAAESESLRVLEVPYSGVSDLRPLSKLRNLTTIDATACAIEYLSDGESNNLKYLWIMGNKLKTEEIERFEKTHPSCIVGNGWNRTLKILLADVTRIEIEQLFEHPGDEDTVPVRFVETDKDVIRNLTQGLAVDPCEANGGSDFYDYNMKFYRGERCVCSLDTESDGQSLRWQLGWPDAVLLTKNGRYQVASMFTHLGEKRMLKNIEH